MLNGIFEVPEDYIENGDGTGRAVYKQSNRVRIQFEKTFTLNQTSTLEQGREVFDESVVVLMQAKGDSNVVAHRATDQHKRMFPAQWNKFKSGQDGELGQSLSQLYGMTPNLLSAFTARGLFSIQQLAEAEDGMISDIPEAERARALAQVWLDSRSGESKTASLIVQATGYKARAEDAEKELAKLRAELAKTKKKRPAARKARPKKEIEAKNEE